MRSFVNSCDYASNTCTVDLVSAHGVEAAKVSFSSSLYGICVLSACKMYLVVCVLFTESPSTQHYIIARVCGHALSELESTRST